MRGVRCPCPSSLFGPLAHLLYHLPSLGHRMEKALDHLELLHGQWLGLQGTSPDKEGGSSIISTPTGL